MRTCYKRLPGGGVCGEQYHPELHEATDYRFYVMPGDTCPDYLFYLLVFAKKKVQDYTTGETKQIQNSTSLFLVDSPFVLISVGEPSG